MKIFSNFIFLLVVVLIAQKTSAQCGVTKLVDSCSVMPKEFMFSKSRVIEIKNKKDAKGAIYSMILTKGQNYLITICEGGKSFNKGRMVIDLLDAKDRLITSSYDPKQKKYYNKIVFNCNASGMYYLAYGFDGPENIGCGVSSIGIEKKKKKK